MHWIDPLHYALEGLMFTQFHKDHTMITTLGGGKVTAEKYLQTVFSTWSYKHVYNDIIALILFIIFLRYVLLRTVKLTFLIVFLVVLPFRSCGDTDYSTVVVVITPIPHCPVAPHLILSSLSLLIFARGLRHLARIFIMSPQIRSPFYPSFFLFIFHRIGRLLALYFLRHEKR
jgi:hypothetical protein